MGSVGFAVGCTSDPDKHLYTLVQAPEDMVTGKSTWYATTCRECPAGCGVLAKNREGRVVKLEGNPSHPVNKGKLCARGQSALQGLYNPDRLTTPLLKTDSGWQSIDYPKAISIVQERLGQAAAKGPDRTAMLTEVVGDTLLNLFKTVLHDNSAQAPLVYEALGFESLKYAHSQLFGSPILPGYRMEKADLVVAFGADFLETWLSPVEYARKFKSMHTVKAGKKGLFLNISPYQTLTAANADQWYPCRPGSEAVAVMMLIQNALKGGRGHHLPLHLRGALLRMTRPYTVAKVAELTDLPVTELGKVSHIVMSASRTLILGAGTAADGTPSVALDLASALLNTILDPDLSLYDFDQRHRVEIASSRSDIMTLWKSVNKGDLDLLLLNNVNPLYSMPPGSGVAKAMARKEMFVAVFSNVMDETAAAADLIIPVQSPLESWDIYESKPAIKATMQPTLGKITAAPNLGDLFLQFIPAGRRPAVDYKEHLIKQLNAQAGVATAQDWIKIIQSGGRFSTGRDMSAETKPSITVDAQAAQSLSNLLSQPPKQPTIYVAPSLRYMDGRGANRSWLSEIPDPVTQVAWQTLAWVHPKTMEANRWSDGDNIRFETANGQIQVQAFEYGGAHPEAVVVPMGQGHSQYGRYAKGQGVNPVALLSPITDPSSGAPSYVAAVKNFSAAGKNGPLAITSGSRVQYDRKIALSVYLADINKPDTHGKGLAMNDFPFTLPLPEGYDHHRDIYPSHEHDTYRWGMVVDLDRCIGCSACIAACYAENNVGVVGKEQVVKGREMAWIRIERYEDPDDPTRQIYFPMMCQHCDNAPCEAVCPVYAPHHSKEGLNNQIYNRCIGTRFCGQNCPYKVRRFNWLEWQWPEPLQLQLNPNVTVRTKGVMEKCSFCIQRIKVAHGRAKNEKRTIADGEVIPACVQTCPTDALYFGNLMDPESTVRKLTADPRAYQVLGYLNTKPAVIYLKKVLQTI